VENRLFRRCLTVLCFIAFFIAFNAKANYTWVQVGVNGLTCSQCSRSVEMSIRKLDFVQDVVMNLEHTEGKIIFKPNAKVDIKKIAKAVVDAGFSVRYLTAGFTFENIAVSNGFCYPFEGKQLQFVKVDSKNINGEVTLKFLGKNFLADKEYKMWKKDLEATCPKSQGEILYVTL
jgi:copper chaperone CopZ